MSIDTIQQDEKNQPAKVYEPTDEEQQDISYANGFRKSAYNQTKPERRKWRNTFQRYMFERDLSEYDYIEDMPIGLTYESIESIAADLPGREFGFRVKNVGDEDVRNSILVSQVVKRDWERPEYMNGPKEMEVIKKGMAGFGNAFALLYWGVETDETGKVTKACPKLKPLNIFDCYYDKYFPDIQSLPEFGYTQTVSLQWLKDHAEAMGFKNVEYVKGKPSRTTEYNESSDDVEKVTSPVTDVNDDRLKEVKLFEIQSNKNLLTLCLDGEQTIWLRKTKNEIGMKSVIHFRLRRHLFPNRLLGDTPVTNAGEIEDAIQRQLNQAYFNNLLVDNPNFSYDQTDPDIDPRRFVTAPGAGIPRGPKADALTPIRFDSHVSESLAMINALLSRFERVVRKSNVASGQGDPNVDTAAEAQILDVNAKVDTDKVVDGMKGTFQDMWVILRKMYEVYGEESTTIKLYAPELLEKLAEGLKGEKLPEGTDFEIKKEDLILERDLDVEVDYTVQNKAVLSNRLLGFNKLIAQDQTVPARIRFMIYQQYLQFNDLDSIAKVFDEVTRQTQSSDVALADEENIKMAGGTALPSTPNPSQQHTQRHIEYLRSSSVNPESMRLLKEHIQGEITQLEQKAGLNQPTENQGQGQPPQAPGMQQPMPEQPPQMGMQ